MPSWAGTAIATICMLTFCIRSPTGRISASPAPRGGDWILPNLNTMPCSNCCTPRTERPATTAPRTTSTTKMITMAAIIATSPSQTEPRQLSGRRHVFRLPADAPHLKQQDHGDDADQAGEDHGLLFARTPGALGRRRQ